jgi:hypothetical protein
MRVKLTSTVALRPHDWGLHSHLVVRDGEPHEGGTACPSRLPQSRRKRARRTAVPEHSANVSAGVEFIGLGTRQRRRHAT